MGARAILPDRRRGGHIRFPVQVPTVTEPVGVVGSVTSGQAENLSRSGILLRLGGALSAGAPVRVSLRLRRRQPVTLTGTTVWVKPHPDFPGWAVGIRFNDELPGEMVVEIAEEESPPWRVPSPSQ